ncbi:MAG: hypothetical protein AAGF12_02795 [Myxococcota bacterium]
MARDAGDLELEAEAIARQRRHDDLADARTDQWHAQRAHVDALKATLRTLSEELERLKRESKR